MTPQITPHMASASLTPANFDSAWTAVFNQFGIDEALRYFLYISQQIADIARINLICTTRETSCVIPIADSSRENFYKVVTEQTHSCTMVHKENIGTLIIENDLDALKKDILAMDSNAINLPFYSHASMLRFPLLVKAEYIYLLNLWSDRKDAFTREIAERIQPLLAPVRACLEKNYGEHPFLQGSAAPNGGSEKLRQCRGLSHVYEAVRRVAPTAATVLIEGESGTGKEIVAEAVHELSERRDKRFVRVNCGALTESLLESELFGHVRGAFTGASETRAGFFEFASGGTIFLDEVGELSMQAQTRLLRVLDNHTLQRIGSPETLPVDVRVIAATNRNLRSMIRAGTFRGDLYYRLSVYRIRLPALRDHSVDIDRLVRFFLTQKAARYGQDTVPVPSRAELAKLHAWSWPGNIRELQNVVERALIDRCGRQPGAPLSFDLRQEMEDMEETAEQGIAVMPGIGSQDWPTLEQVEKAYIARVLDKCSYRLTGKRGAAGMLGIHYTTLKAKMEKYHLG